MTPPLPTVSSQWWLKLTLVLLVGGILTLGVWVLINAFLLQSQFSWIDKAWNLALTGGLVWFSTLGLGLMRFMNHSATADHDGITIASPQSSHRYQWSEVRVKVRARVQVIEIRTREGQLLFAVDWMARNANAFKRFLLERQLEASQQKR